MTICLKLVLVTTFNKKLTKKIIAIYPRTLDRVSSIEWSNGWNTYLKEESDNVQCRRKPHP
jgi:hypothetical protein